MTTSDMACRRCDQTIHPRNRTKSCPACHKGRGLCETCYSYAYRHGSLDTYPLPRNAHRPEHDPSAGTRGTTAAYLKGCRCDDCTAAKTRQQKTWRLKALHGRRQVDAAGTIRRLQALAAMGWPARVVGEHIGVTEDQVVLWRKGKHVKVLKSNAARVATAYDRLSMTTGPSSWTRAFARNRGWSPPLAWDDATIDDPAAKPYIGDSRDELVDETAVHRWVDGDMSIRLNKAERVAVVRQTLTAGWPAKRVMTGLRVNGTTWARLRAEALGDEVAAA